MFSYLKVFVFVIVSVLAYASAAPADSTDSNPIFANPCVSKCPIGYDYSPFCANDNQTYPSHTYLTCFESCGINITNVHNGKCTFPSATNDPCVQRCPITDDYSPFCGTDNNDYPSKSYITCFQSCGINVKKAHDGPCLKEQYAPLVPVVPVA